MVQLNTISCNLSCVAKLDLVLQEPPVDPLHQAVLHPHADDCSNDTDGASKVCPVGRHVKHGHLEDVRGNYFKTAHNHHFGGSHPADGLGHQDTAQDAHQRHHKAEDPHPHVPVVEHGFGADGEDANKADNESSNTKPEDKDRVVNMLGLPCNYDDPSRKSWDCQGRQDTNQLIVSFVGLSMVMLMIMDTGVDIRLDRLWRDREECWRSGQDHDSCEEGDGHYTSPDTTVVTQDDAGQDHSKSWRREEYGGAISQWHSSHSFKYSQ